MMTLEDIQKRFEEPTEKEHWEKLQDTFVFRGQRECRNGNEFVGDT